MVTNLEDILKESSKKLTKAEGLLQGYAQQTYDHRFVEEIHRTLDGTLPQDPDDRNLIYEVAPARYHADLTHFAEEHNQNLITAVGNDLEATVKLMDPRKLVYATGILSAKGLTLDNQYLKIQEDHLNYESLRKIAEDRNISSEQKAEAVVKAGGAKGYSAKIIQERLLKNPELLDNLLQKKVNQYRAQFESNFYDKVMKNGKEELKLDPKKIQEYVLEVIDKTADQQKKLAMYSVLGRQFAA